MPKQRRPPMLPTQVHKIYQFSEKILFYIKSGFSGGILGLCMGFSLISAAEIVYHCFGGIFKTSYSDTDSEGILF